MPLGNKLIHIAYVVENGEDHTWACRSSFVMGFYWKLSTLIYLLYLSMLWIQNVFMKVSSTSRQTDKLISVSVGFSNSIWCFSFADYTKCPTTMYLWNMIKHIVLQSFSLSVLQSFSPSVLTGWGYACAV